MNTKLVAILLGLILLCGAALYQILVNDRSTVSEVSYTQPTSNSLNGTNNQSIQQPRVSQPNSSYTPPVVKSNPYAGSITVNGPDGYQFGTVSESGYISLFGGKSGWQWGNVTESGYITLYGGTGFTWGQISGSFISLYGPNGYSQGTFTKN